jgi:hypothetical protein
MRKRRKPLWFFACLAAALAVIVLLGYDSEPSYQGRSFTQWCELHAKLAQAEGREAEAAQAARAIRLIGTNGLPLLMKSLHYSSLGLHLRQLADRLPAGLSQGRILRLTLLKERIDATAVFAILGPQASPAVPELAALMCSTNNPDLASEAAYCLAVIGKDGLPPLVEALSQPRLPCCRYAAFELSRYDPAVFGTNLLQAVPVLAQRAADNDPDLARFAIRALGRINADPQNTVPALIIALHSTNDFVRFDAARSLMEVGPPARAAVPALLQCLTDPDWAIRSMASNALHSIASESLSGPPVRE